MSARPLALALALAALALGCAALGLGGLAVGQSKPTPSNPLADSPALFMSRAADPAHPDAAEIERGRALAMIGDCVSCHTRAGGPPMAGGLGMNTPFGTIFTPNITPDRDTGIGGWTADQFWRAMHEGKDDGGHNLYPAFPYVYFSKIPRADSDALFAWLNSLQPVRYSPPANRLPFPLNVRLLVGGWNMLFFREAPFREDPAKSAAWNRGAFLVNTLGHCGQCHTPTNLLGANEDAKAFQGGDLDNWVAPDLTSNPRTGLGSWSADDIVAYLKTGRNGRAQAGGAMAEVVSYSTSFLPDADLRAIAAYLKDLSARPDGTLPAPDATAMRRGGAIYSDACASCHLEEGRGQPGYFPPLHGDAVSLQDDPTGLIHLILAGARTAPTPTRPTPLSMPSFAWKLDDQEVADVSTFLRNGFGNHAPPVTVDQVRKVRRRLDLGTSYPTDSSGDHPNLFGSRAT